MNLIDRDKLIERLEISGCETCRFGGEYCVDCKLIDAHRVLSAIESLPTVNEWIPVSEPPKVNGNYFIAYQYRRGGIGAAEIPTDTETMHYASAFYGNARWDIEHHLVCEVIAWMPIPIFNEEKQYGKLDRE